MRRVLVDTGALVALVRERDEYHERVLHFLGEFRVGELLSTVPVLTETLHLVPARHGVSILDLVCAAPWRVLDVSSGLPRIAELLRKYADRPMDFADASLVWAAEQSAAREILTTDQDFEIYRTRSQHRLATVL